jgi:hypothetical protein
VRLLLILVWLIVTAVLFVRSRRKARLDPLTPRGLGSWRPMLKALFHAALISGLVVFVGGSLALALLTGQVTMSH